MVKSHCLQLRAWPSFFCNFHQFNFRAALVHHPVNQKEVQELLANRAIEPLTGGVGLNSSVFVASKHLAGFILFSVSSDLIAACTYLLLGYLLLIRYGNVFNRVIILSPLILRILTYTFLLSSIIIIFL